MSKYSLFEFELSVLLKLDPTQGRSSTSCSDYLLTQVMTRNLVSINGRKKDHGRKSMIG